MTEPRRIIIAMGSNHQQQSHIDMAREFLRDAFLGVCFSDMLWTEPIGVASDKFLNGLAVTFTPLDEAATTALLKDIERHCGDSPALRRCNIVNMGLDLLCFDGERRHDGDWERPYIKTLMKCLDTSLSLSHS